MKYVEYLQTDGTKYGWQIPLQVGYNTTIEMDFEPLSGRPNSDGWYNFFLTNGNQSNLTTYYGGYDLNDVGGGFLGVGYSPRLSFTSGTRYLFELDNTGAMVDNVQVSTVTNVSQSSSSSIIYINSANDFQRSPIAKYYGFKVYDNGTLVFDLRPALDNNDAPCFYEVISETNYYHTKFDSSQGDPIVGPILSTIFVSADKTTMPSSGGTINVTVNSETDWTASTTGSWFTMSSDSGTSADTAITITVPSTTSLTQVQDTITFTNATGDTDSLTIKQRKYNAGGGTYLMAIGGESVETFYIGGEQVDTIYLGSEIVYQSGPFVGLKMKSSVSLGKGSGETFNLKIKSSEPWTLSVDSNATWLSASTLSGPTGDTTVVLETTSENDTQSARTTVITATTANFSATCEVTQIYLHYVKYIWTNPLTANTNVYIVTDICPTTATTMRFKYQGKNMNSSAKLLGFSHASEEDVYNWASDSQDYRMFPHQGITFDYNNSRIGNTSFNAQADGVDFDLTIGNNYVYDNIGATMLCSGTVQTTQAVSNIPIMVNISCIWVQSLEIWEGQTKVFDGQAAVDDANNIVGLYDSISDSWKYNANAAMTYEELPQPTASTTGTLSISVGNLIEEWYDENDTYYFGVPYTITLSGQSQNVVGFAYMGMNQMDYDNAIDSYENYGELHPDSLEYFIANANYVYGNTVTDVLGPEGTPEEGWTVDYPFVKAYAIDANNDLITSISAITQNISMQFEPDAPEELCSMCGGSGEIEEDGEMVTCPNCGGSGIEPAPEE